MKATLRNHSRVLEYICQVFKDILDKLIDTSRDAYYRTALHYGYANLHGRDVLDVLLDYGASEFTMDKVLCDFVFNFFNDLPHFQHYLWHMSHVGRIYILMWL